MKEDNVEKWWSSSMNSIPNWTRTISSRWEGGFSKVYTIKIKRICINDAYFILIFHLFYENEIMSIYHQFKLRNDLSILSRSFFIFVFNENCLLMARFPFIWDNKRLPKTMYRTKTIKTYLFVLDYTIWLKLCFT